jgi:hypothetical protein
VGSMAGRGITLRSLLGTAGGGALAGLTRPAGALARTLARGERDSAPGFALAPEAKTAALSLLPQTLPAGPGQPPIIAREAWAQGRCPPAVTPEYGEVLLGFVHHTENPNGYSAGEVPGMLRAIYAFHRYGRGWNDIGYNFLIDRFGRIFEARAGGADEAVIGAHAGGYNYCSTGVAVLGEYGAQRISPTARQALAHLLAWKLSLHGAPVAGRVTVRVNPAGAIYSRFPARAHVSLPRLAGHRDADTTSCPGNALYGELSGLRHATLGLAGHVAKLTLAARRDEASGAIVALAGALTWLGGAGGSGGGEGVEGNTGIAGAPVLIQARGSARHGQLVSEQTLAQTQTAADGSFTLPILQQPPSLPRVSLRALCPGVAAAPGSAPVPAAVSPPLELAGTISFAAPGATAPGSSAPGSSAPGSSAPGSSAPGSPSPASPSPTGSQPAPASPPTP